MLLLLGLWVLLSIAVGLFAHNRGRGRVTWALISLLVSPVIATILLLSGRDLAAEGVITPRRSKAYLAFRIVANMVMAAAVIAILVSILNRGGMKPVRLSQAQSVEISIPDFGHGAGAHQAGATTKLRRLPNPASL